MVIIISGETHTGKTYLAQKLLEKYHYPYLSIDQLKMGLIRSKHTNLNALSSTEELTKFLWPIVLEIIKTAIENDQNLIVEGCYVPFNYKEYFSDEYLKNIKCIFLIMSANYLKNHFDDVIKYADVIEKRLDCKLDLNELIIDNENNLRACICFNVNYYLIDNYFDIEKLVRSL